MKDTAPPEEDPDVIICALSGSNDIGSVCEAAATALGIPEGPIRLLNGYPGAKGFGLRHIEDPKRAKAIAGLGFPSCKAFVFEVAAHWTCIHRKPGDRPILVLPKAGHDLAIVVDWRDGFWSVTTALPYRAIHQPKVYEKPKGDEREPRLRRAKPDRFVLSLPKKVD